jgi:hypothetical protein
VKQMYLKKKIGNEGRHSRKFEVTLSGKTRCRCYVGELISCIFDDTAGRLLGRVLLTSAWQQGKVKL